VAHDIPWVVLPGSEKYAKFQKTTLEASPMIASERTAGDWFKEAESCYVEKHQGCAWCGGSHRVFRLRQGQQVQFYCNACDFRVGFDQATGEYFSIPGEKRDAGEKTTMLDY
jgi:hypothetical protein